MGLPKIALTVGDPAGIGPEIVEKAAADPSVRAVCEPIVFAPPADGNIRPGEVSAAAGRAAYDTLVRAVEAARRGEVDAIATAPGIAEGVVNVVFDAETSGGLLIAIPRAHAAILERELSGRGVLVACIGEFVAASGVHVELV